MCIRDRSHPDWWQDKKNPDRHGIRIPVLDENGVQKVGARNRKQWKRVLTDATAVSYTHLTLIHELTYRRNNRNLHVYGYQEEGTITTPDVYKRQV